LTALRIISTTLLFLLAGCGLFEQGEGLCADLCLFLECSLEIECDEGDFIDSCKDSCHESEADLDDRDRKLAEECMACATDDVDRDSCEADDLEEGFEQRCEEECESNPTGDAFEELFEAIFEDLEDLDCSLGSY
jgi:hypothetical protein